MRGFGIAALLCALTAMMACQKIDADDLSYDNQHKTERPPSGGTTGNDGNVPEGEGGQDAVVPPDGGASFGIDGHVAVLAEPVSNDKARVTLVSLSEWDNVPSAFHGTDGDKAKSITANYREGDITGWHIPTRAEADKLKALYGCHPDETGQQYLDTLVSLNNRLTGFGGMPLKVWKEKTGYPAYRYLCDDAEYSFSLKKGTNKTKAGASTLYHLRLLKDTVVTIKNTNN